jgi:transportin-1
LPRPVPIRRKRITELQATPEYAKYMTYILGQLAGQVDDFVRQQAGLLLKNHVGQHWQHMTPEVQEYVKNEAPRPIGDPNVQIRNVASSVITSIVAQFQDLGSWPGLVPILCQYLDTGEHNAMDGSLNSLYKICEDSADKLDTDAADRPLNVLVPKFLGLFAHAHPRFRELAVNSIGKVLPLMPLVIVEHKDAYLQALSGLGGDPSPAVRKGVCQSIVMLFEIKPEFIAPAIESVTAFMLERTQDADESVALEACEFWTAFCDQEWLFPTLRAIIPTLVPILLARMVYSQDDIEYFEAEEEDNQAVADRPEEMRPIFHKAKQEVETADGGDDEEESDDDGDSEVTEWNLRKCAAAGLDMIATTFGDDILVLVLPLLQEKLSSQGHWSVRESGVLALGAIAEGCYMGMCQHMEQLFPFMLSLLSDPVPLVRSITCWALSRYASWAVQLVHGDEQGNPDDRFFKPLMEELLKRMLDHNKKVQEAACSAFATLTEDAREALTPYLQPILQNLLFAFEKYQAKNLLILYDAIGTLADSVGHDLNQPHLTTILLPPLIAKWNQLADSDRQLFPLLECLSSVAQALRSGFQEFAQPVWERCLRIIQGTLQSHAMAASTGEEPTDKEFVVCCLDLLSGITEGLGPGMEVLVPSSNVLALLFECMKWESPDAANVRQSAFALCGDLGKACPQHLEPLLPHFLPVLTRNLDPDWVSVCNNASWALGEIAVKVRACSGSPCAPHAPTHPAPTHARTRPARTHPPPPPLSLSLPLPLISLSLPPPLPPSLSLLCLSRSARKWSRTSRTSWPVSCPSSTLSR